ncbi:aminotransferase class I/II-fold pyridoxal phosphate-dependent enzyme [Longimicrobium sp.]|uniref:aminotransferase class I/II-fold pyridoxal phosphate-dependent enzyme n=1 Tax=Longimicrobium sp. TaxID=2029185 RepID=UPI002E317A1F|nr:aminotransferase class I/II-fold pyridoxal phosphate-dependent enzyme [Longimicrobium sp.]HEX6040393.1 aminotransferase class I/II-fold pyridoxal phosphate-dependent enzyme [Longimicrobium sp.]
MNASEHISIVEGIHREARGRGVLFQGVDDEPLQGRTIHLDGRPRVTFGSCSYLGLEFHPALIQGVTSAVRRYGTQFSQSRGYASAPPYEELESLLSTVFGGHVLVTPSTTLGHQMVLPTLATEKDAILVDNQAHRSVQVAATLAQAGGARVEVIRHRELDARLLETVARLARTHRTVWFAIDGIYSMYGDFAPLGLLRQVLDVAPNVRLYVDDAHGMSWAGRHGRGWFLSRFPLSQRVVLGTSLVKGFAAGGGAFVFASAEERDRVRLCGGPYVFSGPMQPPMLGAALGSARVHLSDEIDGLQRTFAARAALTDTLLREHDLPLLLRNEGPIFFLRMGRAEAAMTVAERMMEDGWHITISTYPSVPQRRAGIRLAVTALHTPTEIRGVIEALARHVPRALAEHGISRGELDELYHDAVPGESWGGPRPRAIPASPVVRGTETPLPQGWRVEVCDTIAEVDRTEWDRCMSGRGASSWDALRMAEALFGADQPLPEHRWRFRYVVVRRGDGTPAAATYFSRCLHKDDMFSDARVSAEVERLRRAGDPYLLSSEVVTLGSYLSEGDHLFLDRAHPAWPAALGAIHGEMMHAAREWSASAVILRDFAGDDGALDAWMGARDFVKLPILHSHRLDLREWSEEGRAARAGSRTRRLLRDLRIASEGYRVEVWGVNGRTPADPGFASHLYSLYRDVAARGLRINTYALPEDVIPALLANPSWEVVALSKAEGDAERPVSWFAAHRQDGHYAAFMCGVDYADVTGTSSGAYRQMLLAMMRRARELGAHTLHMGMDAEVEKRRFGAVPHPTCAYVLALEHDAGDRLQAIATEVGLRVA